MALIEFEGLGGVLVGFGAGLAAPSAFPRIGSTLHPAAKAAVKGLIVAVDGVQAFVAEASEQLRDLVAEVQAERAPGSRSNEKAHAAKAGSE